MSSSLSDMLRQIQVADEDASDSMQSSQDFIGSADFITPVEQQFPIDFNKENESAPPGLRSKRPRESIQRPEEEEEEEECTYYSKDDDARLGAVRQRVMSPPCIRNPFVGEDVPFPQPRKCKKGHATLPSQCRYHEEFHEIEEIGRGNFSCVHKVLKRIDGCLYAMKRSREPLDGNAQMKKALREVQALAYLGSHENVVRYFSSWLEDDFLYIQLELCECTLRERTRRNSETAEHTLLDAMWQSLKALAHIHSRGVAHLDLKPDNIYYSGGVFKIGDFGLASRIDGSLSIEEGDARYLPLELLNDDFSELAKADIFSLGATFYELARGTPLTSTGSQFQALRQGKLSLLPGFSLPFQALLRGLMHPDPRSRPTAAEACGNVMFRSLV